MKSGLMTSVQEKVLSVFLENEAKQWYVNELIRKTGEYPNSIQYTLTSLEKTGFLKSEVVNNRRFFSLNLTHPVLENIKDILVKKGLLGGHISKQESTSQWIKLLNRDATLAFQFEVPLVNRDMLPRVVHQSVGNFWYNGITYGVYYKKAELEQLAEVIERVIKKEHNFAKNNIRSCYKLGEALIQNSTMPKEKDLARLNNANLLKLLVTFRTSYQEFLPYLMYPHIIERYFIQKIKRELITCLRKIQKESKVDETLQILTTPTIHDIEEQIDTLVAALEFQKHGWNTKTQALLKKLHQKYCWQPFWAINATPLSKNYYEDSLELLSQGKMNISHEIKRIKREQKQRKIDLQNVLVLTRASKMLRQFVQILQAYMYLRTYRKNIISKAHYLHMPLITEITSRMEAKDYFDLISYEEMIAFLKDDKQLSHNLLKKRREGWGVIATDGFAQIVSGKDQVLEVMEQFQIGMQPIVPVNHIVIKGTPACEGSIIGRVKIVNDKDEFEKITKGDILVTPMTTPDFVPLLKKITGIITDEGGVTCHAAIISREYAFPV